MDELNEGIQIMKTLKHVMNIVRQNIESQFQEMKLTGPQGMLIGTLAHSEQMKISELSEKIGLSNSTVSGIIDRLEKQGLVERIRSEEDRRVVYVKVTEEFQKSAKKRFQELEEKLEALMLNASSEEREKILEGLDTLKHVIERELQ